MSALIIGLYGIYLLMVGASGNAKTLQQYASADAPGFLPWAVSLGALAVVYEIPQTKRMAGPFILLLALTFVLRNFDSLAAQYRELAAMATGTRTAASVSNEPTVYNGVQVNQGHG